MLAFGKRADEISKTANTGGRFIQLILCRRVGRRQAISVLREIGRRCLAVRDGGALYHSQRSDAIGSVRMARRAGIKHAANAISVIPADTAASVSGSSFATPYSRCEKLGRIRVRIRAADTPIPIPIAAILNPWTRTMRKTSSLPAPRAMRIPISRTRCAAEYDTTP